ncbi:MAG TPA: WbqC family protein [Drouetiella sp.]
MSKTCAILQSNYIPWKGYFDLINSVDEFVIYDCVQYTTNDWRNRNKIKTQNGLQWLTIPISSSFSQKDKISEVVTSNNIWRKKHWNSLCTNYAKAPYFSMYKPLLNNLYNESEESSLSKINRAFIDAICKSLEIKTTISDSSKYVIEGDKNQRLINLCKQTGANVYLSGPAAKSYLDEKEFEANGIAVRWMDYSDYPDYTQLHPPFEHYVSVLDLLFNAGPDSYKYMKSSHAC